MPPFETPQEIAARLTPQQFELLVRSYIKTQRERLPKKFRIMFWAPEYREEPGHWDINTNGTETKGEILAEVVTEHMRRLGFEESCKLNLIEHDATVVEPAPVEDEIPY